MNNGYPSFPHQRHYAQQSDNGGGNAFDMSGEGLDLSMNFAMAADTHDFNDMASQEDKANRRKSMPAPFNVPMHMEAFDTRRQSMLDFNPEDTSLAGFPFDPPSEPALGSAMIPGGNPFPHTATDMQNDTLQPADLSIDTQFAQNGPFSNMQTPASAYTSPMHPGVSMDMDMNSYPGFPSMPMDMSDPNLAMMGTDLGQFSSSRFMPMVNSSVGQDFTASMPTPHAHVSAVEGQPLNHYGTMSLTAGSDIPSGMQNGDRNNPQSRPHNEQLPTPSSNQMTTAVIPQQETAVALPREYDVPIQSFAQMFQPPPGGWPTSQNGNVHTTSERFKSAYSPSGFDLLGALYRVAKRPNPQIDIGNVDLSCAFVVCDARAEDVPIIYCSDNFQGLTGYERAKIIGQNCRFLQDPDGKVYAGMKRKYVDNDSVRYLREMIEKQQEAQISLINYRNGGQPFMNLLTMIPIAWEDNGPITHFIGFQVDIVEQPGSVQNKNIDGTFRVNYSRGIQLPSYIFNSDMHRPHSEIGQTISNDEVSSVLASYSTATESEISGRIWDKILLENTDDVIHVLSLKGLFLYLSPSSNKVLEYDPGELIGTGLSSVCHPSDIVPVTRELKDTTNGSAVNVVFRIRRKRSGYMWFEGHGSLHTEPGKGRKCIILVGRERPVYTLSKLQLQESGGIGDSELWSKMSTAGMFLFVSGNVRQLLDRQPEELVGTSIQALMRPESKQNFIKVLEEVRTGKKGQARHEMINRRGQVLQACTTLYPGDAVEGEKPTFVVAQTRLLKYSRGAQGQRPGMYKRREHNSDESRGSVASSQAAQSPTHRSGTGAGTPATNSGMDTPRPPTDTAGENIGNSANQNPIGHQDHTLASDDNVFDELKTTRCTSWQYELRQMEKRNRYLAEEVQSLLAAKKKRKRRKGAGSLQKDCANCHTRVTPEWRRGPSGNRDLCNSCGLRYAKQIGRVSPRNSAHSVSDKGRKNVSPRHTQPILPSVLSEIKTQTSIPSTSAPGDKRVTSQSQANADSHASKVARMEAAASHGFGGGIPAKIEEAVEPE